MGKRPDWLRRALEAGRALEDFLVAAPKSKESIPAMAPKRAPKPKAGAAAETTPTKKRAAGKKVTASKRRAKPVAGNSAG
jgi:hypothetical protein